MLRQKKWIAIILCSLTLLMAFSVSTGPAHAASNTIHTRLNHFTHLMPNSEGPPGCVAIQLGDYTVHVSYAGSNYIVENQLLGWYALAGDESYHFCDQILCVANVDYNGGKLVPAGIIGVYCRQLGPTLTASKRSNPQGGGDGITAEATVNSGYVTSCAEYWIGGMSGHSDNTGGGCIAGQVRREVPSVL